MHCKRGAAGPPRTWCPAPLLFTLLAAAAAFINVRSGMTSCAIRDRLHQPRRVVAVPSEQAADGVTPAIGGTLGRIVMMQVATIIGGMFARTYGDMAPWLILIGVKTLFDYQRPDRRLATHR